MARAAKWSPAQGLLLVEAVLSAMVIAVGLVFISRGLSAQLKALRSLEEYDTLLSLASGKLLEFEAKRVLPTIRAGTFGEPYGAYGWTAAATLRDGPDDPKDQEGNPLVSDVLVRVQRQDGSSSSVRLHAMWPSEWLQQ